MVLSSVSPLFVLWAIRGSSLIGDRIFVVVCIFLVLGPNAFLLWRISIAKKREDKRELAVGTAEDHRDHILVYLFAMLLPFYSEDLDSWRNVGSSLAALVFIVFLFWHLNLHYMNVVFAVRGFRVFTVYSPADGNAFSGRARFALITRRLSIESGDTMIAYRLSDTVYLETDA